jgi:hypothetical protein
LFCERNDEEEDESQPTLSSFFGGSGKKAEESVERSKFFKGKNVRHGEW